MWGLYYIQGSYINSFNYRTYVSLQKLLTSDVLISILSFLFLKFVWTYWLVFYNWDITLDFMQFKMSFQTRSHTQNLINWTLKSSVLISIYPHSTMIHTIVLSVCSSNSFWLESCKCYIPASTKAHIYEWPH